MRKIKIFSGTGLQGQVETSLHFVSVPGRRTGATETPALTITIFYYEGEQGDG